MRQLTLQKLDKLLHPEKPPQFFSVPGPAAYQESSPIMLVNDPTKVQNQRGKSNIFQVLCIISPQKWSHHFIPFGLFQKGYKDLTLVKFIYGYISIYLEHPEEISQQHYFTHLHDLMRLSVFYKWDTVRNFHAAMLNHIESGRAR